jgi:hypothetical protein
VLSEPSIRVLTIPSQESCSFRMHFLELVIMSSGVKHQLGRFLLLCLGAINICQSSRFCNQILVAGTKFYNGISWFLSSSLLSSEMHLPSKCYYEHRHALSSSHIWRNWSWLFDNYKANNMLLMILVVALLKSGKNYA